MGFIGFLFISLALAMDCFSVSITCGIIQKRMGRQVLLMAVLFGFFQALMPFVGWLAADLFRRQIDAYDHWIAFAMLVFIGGKMIWNALAGGDEAKPFDPSSLKVLLALAMATSIDALAVGFSFLGMGIRSFSDAVAPLVLIALVSFGMSVIGKYIGVRIGRRFNFPAELIGGVILVGIGVKVLVSHLCA